MNLMPAELLAPETCPTCGSDDPKYDDVYLGDDTDKSAIEHDSIANPEPCPDPFHTPPERGDEGAQRQKWLARCERDASTLASLCDALNTWARQYGTTETPSMGLVDVRASLDALVFRLQERESAAKREGAERCGPTLQDFIDHLKAEFDAGNHKPWNAAAGPALNFCARWPATDEEKP